MNVTSVTPVARRLTDQIAHPGEVTVMNAPEGADALLLAQAQTGAPFIFIARDSDHAARTVRFLRFVRPTLRVLTAPGWDCLPYDRVSPSIEVMAERISALHRLAAAPDQIDILVITINAALQKAPPRALLASAAFTLRQGRTIPRENLLTVLGDYGYRRVATVREPGEYAVRGGLLDLYPVGDETPVRVDFLDDEPESLRPFDPMSQRSGDQAVDAVTLIPVSEALLNAETIACFRRGYRDLFGAAADHDPLYEALSEHRPYPGMEHWLPLFYPQLDAIFDWLPTAPVFIAARVDEIRAARVNDIMDYYQARRDALDAGDRPAAHRKDSDREVAYKPTPPEMLFVLEDAWREHLTHRAVIHFTPFAVPAEGAQGQVLDAAARAIAPASAQTPDALAGVSERLRQGDKVLIAAHSPGSAQRLTSLMRARQLAPASASQWADLTPGQAALSVLDLEHSFAVDSTAVYTEQDILGERLSRPPRPRRRGADIITEATALTEGDLVVHTEHGIGRYDRLETLNVNGAPHDCLKLLYAGDDRLYVPVENIDLLSRFGNEDAQTPLDRLGSAAWQARKAATRERIRALADKLLNVAAARALESGVAMTPPAEAYDAFRDRFPYVETDDQAAAIQDVEADLTSGRPMDRLICGDVGFGKTEAALRAAFIAAINGFQVAIVAPTTLLARQHHQVFLARFQDLPIRVGRLSRLTPAPEAAAVKTELASGALDIVVGTHAVLSASVRFARLGLVVVDEEQHFGVTQKERLKQLKSDVHVLTLTATPIPRTLQMALSGARDLSVIATPPVDRLAVRSFVLPRDRVVLREAILRERDRGGRTYYVCPRIADLQKLYADLQDLTPDVRIATAHGRMPARELDDIMTAFVDGRYDLLLSTNIVESGLDIASANTMIIHRADLFGLAQLYQLRGRIGRGKARAYCYFTVPPGRTLSSAAQKRLEVIHALDSLGAGLSLASHDMDIRGAGNLLGDEQSGRIREVGIELYQKMLEEAINARRAGHDAPIDDDWSPALNLGGAVLIPDHYITDLPVRLGLYRRLANLKDRQEIDLFAEELADRFGPLPGEVENLLRVMALKLRCRQAGIEKVDAGPRGAVVAFRGNAVANPAGLVALIHRQPHMLKLRPDHMLVLSRAWKNAAQRLDGVEALVDQLARINQDAAA